jgi:hypothetical protein
MNIAWRLLLTTLVGGLLLLPGAAGAQHIKSSTDDKGTICIGNSGAPKEVKKGPEENPVLWPEEIVPPDPNARPLPLRRSRQSVKAQRAIVSGRKPPIVPQCSAAPAPQPQAAPQVQPTEPPAPQPHQGD